MVGDTSDGRCVRNNLIEALWVECDGRVSAIGGIPAKERTSQLTDIDQEFRVKTNECHSTVVVVVLFHLYLKLEAFIMIKY